jgi:hypothetical protein
LNEGGEEEIHSFIFGNADVCYSSNRQSEKNQTDNGKQIKINAVFATDGSEEIFGDNV